MTNLPPGEEWFTYKEYKTVEGEDTPRLLTPWANPMEYEYPFDSIFETEEKALAYKKEFAPQEEFVLVKMTLQPIKVVPAEEDEDH